MKWFKSILGNIAPPLTDRPHHKCQILKKFTPTTCRPILCFTIWVYAARSLPIKEDHYQHTIITNTLSLPTHYHYQHVAGESFVFGVRTVADEAWSDVVLGIGVIRGAEAFVRADSLIVFAVVFQGASGNKNGFIQIVYKDENFHLWQRDLNEFDFTQLFLAQT